MTGSVMFRLNSIDLWDNPVCSGAQISLEASYTPRIRVRVECFISNGLVIECYCTRHFICTIQLWCISTSLSIASVGGI